MSQQVSAAVGTQRQFAKQPEMPYALRLNNVNFSAGIHERTDYDTQLLAKSLGVFPNALMNLHASIEKGKQENATLLNADKILAGKTKEDLKTFDRMATLQNVEGHNMTHNKYAMAVLEKGIGQMASTYAKQEWSGLPESEKPASVEEAVNRYNEILKKNYEEFGQNIQNRTAFDQGYYNGAIQDTMRVANEADARIDDDKRQKMVMLGSVEAQDLIYQGVTGKDFADNIGVALRKMQLGSKDRSAFMNNVAPIMKMLSENDFTTERLNAVADFMYDQDSSIRDQVNLFPFYQKVAQNFDKRVAEDLFSKCVLPNGRLDYAKFNRELAKLPSEFTSPNIPQVPIAISDESIMGNVSPELRNALPSVGGILSMLGVGGSMSVTGAEGNGVKIYLGDTSKNVKDRIMSNLSSRFNTCKVDGDTLTLAGYLGGLDKKADPREISASAFSPDRLDRIRKLAKAKDLDAKREASNTRTRNLNNAKRGARNAVTLEEAEKSILDSDATAEEKEYLLDSVRQSFTPMSKSQFNKLTKEEKALYEYTHPTLNGALSGYARDCNKLDEWEAMSDEEKEQISSDESKFKPYLSAQKRKDKYEAYAEQKYGKFYQDDVYYDDSNLDMETTEEREVNSKSQDKEALANSVREALNSGMDRDIIRLKIQNVGRQMGWSLSEINDLEDELLGEEGLE